MAQIQSLRDIARIAGECLRIEPQLAGRIGQMGIANQVRTDVRVANVQVALATRHSDGKARSKRKYPVGLPPSYDVAQRTIKVCAGDLPHVVGHEVVPLIEAVAASGVPAITARCLILSAFITPGLSVAVGLAKGVRDPERQSIRVPFV